MRPYFLAIAFRPPAKQAKPSTSLLRYPAAVRDSGKPKPILKILRRRDGISIDLTLERVGGNEEASMSFTDVWGFDPDSAMKAQGLVRSQPEPDFTYSAEEERAARIPGDSDSQIYELRRMYRLCFRR
jgi:hypothetical protein